MKITDLKWHVSALYQMVIDSLLITAKEWWASVRNFISFDMFPENPNIIMYYHQLEAGKFYRVSSRNHQDKAFTIFVWEVVINGSRERFYKMANVCAPNNVFHGYRSLFISYVWELLPENCQSILFMAHPEFKKWDANQKRIQLRYRRIRNLSEFVVGRRYVCLLKKAKRIRFEYDANSIKYKGTLGVPEVSFLNARNKKDLMIMGSSNAFEHYFWWEKV